MEQRERILALLDKYVKNVCTDDELDELFDYIALKDHDQVLDEHILKTLNIPAAGGARLDAYKSEGIIKKIFSSHEENSAIIRKISGRRFFILSRVAAAVILTGLIATGIFFFTNNKKEEPFREISVLQKGRQRAENNSEKAMQIELEDGSRVMLQPGATLEYPRHFDSERREVALSGEAFFDIARNPDKPFLVYHEHLVTRVLGTSFYIRYNKEHKEIEVEVSSGKVEVYENVKNKDRSNSNGVIITRNQKVVYAEEKRLFSTLLVANPLPAIVKDEEGAPVALASSGFEFEKANMSDIIALLKTTYGIEIELENENMNNCLFTGDIVDENLYSKLNVLCEAIGADYEVKGIRILIKGRGCR